MPFKSFSAGQICSVVLILIFSSVAFAQLDWDDDVIVFGTENDETLPLLVTVGNGQFRAFCISQQQVLRTRKSQLNGEAWGAVDDKQLFLEVSGFGAVADNQYAYIWHPSAAIWRIANSQTEWPDEGAIYAYPELQGVIAMDLVCDSEFEPVDTYLHGFAVYRSESDSAHFGCFRSENRAQSIAVYGQIDSAFLMNENRVSVSGAYTWSGENERLWAAITLDRPGTTGEQVALYFSDDLGQTWSNRFTPDSSSYEQLHLTMLGYEETIMLAYERRNSASVAHDIYFVYSPDNGESWSEPIQLTDHVYDDTRPELEISDGMVGLFYARAQVQAESGQLLFRQTSLNQPWAWEPEIAVSETDAFMISEGYAAAGNANGFSAIWSGRLVGDDGDIFFDASWRGTSVNEQPRVESPRALFTQNPVTGRIEYELPRGTQVIATLYNMLGRTVNQSMLAGSRGFWSAPAYLPSGTYMLTAKSSAPIRIQIVH